MSGEVVGPAVRVVHVPADHDYVRHSTSTDATSTDATSTDATSTAAAGPVAVVPEEPFRFADAVGWLARHGHEVDVLHVHFGFEGLTVAELERFCRHAERAGVALVWTAHDLTNPHLVDQAHHEAQLAVLSRRAVGVVTLTDGAAAEVQQRWDRAPAVLPHPHLAPATVLARPRPAPPRRAVVGLPLGLLRPSVDPGVVRALLAEPQLPGGALLRVTLRQEVTEAGFPRPDRELLGLLRRAHEQGRVDLRVGPRLPDAAMWDELAGLSVLVLPYRWGTHSGWVEAAHDVGTPVVAPDLGRWAEQHPLHLYERGPQGPDAASLVRAVAAALALGPRERPVQAQRRRERDEVVAGHVRLHALAASGGRW